MLFGFWGGAPQNGSHGGKFPGSTISSRPPLFSGKRTAGGVHTYTEVPNEVPVHWPLNIKPGPYPPRPVIGGLCSEGRRWGGSRQCRCLRTPSSIGVGHSVQGMAIVGQQSAHAHAHAPRRGHQCTRVGWFMLASGVGLSRQKASSTHGVRTALLCASRRAPMPTVSRSHQG